LVNFTEVTGSNILLTINLASSMYAVTVVQGGNPNIMEVRVRH
jgi:hypothetical protein